MPHARYLAPEVCINCGSPFISIHWGGNLHKKTCSKECLKIVRNKTYLKLVKKGENNNRWKGGVPSWTCLACGAEFKGYHNKNGKQRKFCSWNCANTFNKGRIMKVRARLRFENELFDLLTERGYSCIRSAGSRGPADLYAFNENHIRVIQIKTTKSFELKRKDGMYLDAIKKLRELPCPPNCRQELWVKPLRKNWIYIILNDLPTDRQELRKAIRSMQWIPFMPKLPEPQGRINSDQ